jgi:hypothetical protein
MSSQRFKKRNSTLKEGQDHEDEDDLPLSQKLKKKASTQQEMMTMEEDTYSDEGIHSEVEIRLSKKNCTRENSARKH